MRDNPFVQNQRFAIASRIGFAVSTAINELVAFVIVLVAKVQLAQHDFACQHHPSA